MSKQRRASGEGNVRQRRDGRWEASAMFAGRRYYLAGRTQAEARAKLRELQRQYFVGQLVAPAKLTLSEHLRHWLDAGQPDWKPKTAHGYERIIAAYWEPALGHIRLQRLTSAMIAAQLGKWRNGHAGGTTLNVYRCLYSALEASVKWGLLASNPAKAVDAPKAERRRPSLWSIEQAAAFLEATRDSRWHVLWALSLGTGCRLGEALALEWGDVDLDAEMVAIRRSVARIARADVVGTPKTRAGVRTVSLPSFAIEALRTWRKNQLTERLRLGLQWQAGERIVSLSDGRVPAPSTVRSALDSACKRAGLPRIRAHDFRHLHASMLLAQGHSLPAVSARLGHAGPHITAAVYSHALKGQDREAAVAIGAALSGESKGRISRDG